MASNDTYTQILGRAIRDFDSIFAQLQNKLVTRNGNIITNSDLSNGQMPTSSYATFIRDQLYKVGNVDISGNEKTITNVTPVLTNGAIASYAGIASGATDATFREVPYSNGKLNLQISIPAAGYYDTNSTITTALSYSDISISENNISDYYDETNNRYVVENTNGDPMLQVVMGKGSVSVSYGAGAQSLTSHSISGTIEINNQGNIQNAVLDPSNENLYSTGYFTIGLDRHAHYEASGTINGTPSVTAGYITNAEVSLPNPSFNINEDLANDQKSKIYIPEGTITASLDSNADVSISANSILGLTTGSVPAGTENTDYYAITASTSDLDVLGTTTAGYVAAGSNQAIGTVADLTKTYYIPGTSVSGTSVDLTLTNSDSHSMISNTETSHVITVSASGSDTKAFSAGFLKAGSYTATASGDTTIYIKEGSIQTTTGISKGTVTNTDSVLSDSHNNNGYNISVAVNATSSVAAGNLTPGYIDTVANNVTSSQNSYTVEVSVDKGHATITPTLTTRLYDTADSLDGKADNEDTIFYSTAPDSGDYYSITASATKSVTPGYIKDTDDVTDGIHINPSQVYYLKKATLKYRVTEDEETSFVEVVNGGYLPSGTLVSVAEIGGADSEHNINIDYANVAVGFNDYSNNILLSSEPNSGNYYRITATKLSTTDSGFISATHGVVTGNTYIAHGSGDLSTSFNNTTLGTISGLDSVNQEYTLLLTTEITNNLAFNEGYIKLGDTSLNGQTGVRSKTLTGQTSITIPAGSFDVTNKNFTVTATKSQGLEVLSSGTSAYYITPTLAGTVTIDVETAGYIKPGDQSVVLNVSNNDQETIHATTYHIKEGTGATSNDWTASQVSTGTLSDNFNTTQSGAYTVTLSGTALAELTLNTGYYGETEKNLSGLKGGHVNLNNSLSIAHGKGTISLSSANYGISAVSGTTGTGTDLSSYFETTASDTNEEYIRVNSSVTVSSDLVKTGANAFVEGYIKEGDITQGSFTPTITRYVKTPKLTHTATGAAQDIYGTTIANNTEVYGPFEIGSYTGDITDASSYGTTADDATTTGLRDGIIIPIKNRFALHDIKVVLSEDAMGSNVVDKLADLEARLAGTYSAS